MTFEFIRVAFPSCLSIGMFFLEQSINIYIAGHLDNPAYLAAIGTGNLIQNCILLAPIWGLNSGFE